MRIDPPKSASLPAHELPQSASVSNQRLPGTGISLPHAGSRLPPLQLGQLVDALVLQELPGGKIFLDIEGSEVEAENPGGLEVGQRLRLRVEQLQPQVVLHITDNEAITESEVLRLWRTYMPFQLNAGESLENLQKQLVSHLGSSRDGELPEMGKLREWLQTLLLQETPPTPERLLRLMTDGGLHYEAKLFRAVVENPRMLREIAESDLKALLIAALHEAELGSGTRELQNAILGQLNNVEGQQAVNLVLQQERTAFQVQIPIFNGTGFSTAALLVERDSKGSGDDKRDSGYSLLFLLDLENFGRMRIDARLRAARLGVIFYVDQDSSITLIKSELRSFRASLEAIGYQEIFLTVKPLREMPSEKQQRFDALAFGAPAKVNLLDVKA